MLKFVPKLLDAYPEKQKADSSRLMDRKWDIVDVLGGLVFNFTYYHSESNYLELSLPSVASIINCIKKMDGLVVESLTGKQ